MRTAEQKKAVDLREPPLIAHVIHRLDVGGMENGLVNLINRIPPDRYRHAVICLTENAEFSRRILRDDVRLFALHKREGKDLGLYFRLWRVLRKLRPELVHTRNLAAIEGVVPAAVAGVPHRIHGEHGRDVQDMDGSSRKYQLLRRLLAPLVDRFIPLSLELESYLVDHVGLSPGKMKRICNGVDLETFAPSQNGQAPLPVEHFAESDSIVIGTVGRMQEVKNPLLLAEAFIRLTELRSEEKERLRLLMVGDGALKTKVEACLRAAGVDSMAWLPGSRDDVPDLLRAMDVFVLPSRAEGISNTILEAMACGVPVVATRVGGNPELVEDGVTGVLVPSQDIESMAHAVSEYVQSPEMRAAHGRAARIKVEREFSINRMVEDYLAVYDEVLSRGKTEGSL